MSPQRIGRYVLLGELGRGGMGVVYDAELHGPAGFRKRVALKVLVEGADVGALAREARIGGLLQHPNVVDTYDVGKADGVVYLAMERVDGPSLGALVRGGRSLPAPSMSGDARPPSSPR